MSRAPNSTAGSIARRTAGELRAFPRQFWLLSGGVVVLLSGVDMVYPFETTYLHTRLGVSMTTVGLLLGVPVLAVLPLHAVGGALTDRYGRKTAMAVAICVVVGLYSTFAFATAVWQIAIAITLEAAIGWALFLTGSNAMVADLLPHERRAEAYSITRVALHIGMVVGPLLGGAIIAADPTFRGLFLTGAGICAAFVVIVLALFKETRPPEARQHGNLVATMAGYAVVLRDRRFLAFCAMSLLPLYGFGQIWAIFPMALRTAHGVSPRSWGFLLAFYALSVAVFQYPVIRWLRRRDHLLLMAASSALIGVGLCGAVLAPWGPLTFLFVFVLGEGVVFLIPISSTVSAELAPVELRGRYMGAWTLVQMGGFALGPTFGGMAMDGLGSRGAFILVGGIGLLGAALFALTAGHFRSAEAITAARVIEEPLGVVPPGA
jgi:MFS family permease